MIQCVLGSAVVEARDRAALAAGSSLEDDLRRLLATRPTHELAHLRALVDIKAEPIDDDLILEHNVRIVLVGIAALRGEDWRRIAPAAAGVPGATRA